MSVARKLVEPYENYEEDISPVTTRRTRTRRNRIPATLKICFVAAFCVVVCLLYLQQQVTSYYLSMELVQVQEQVNVMEQRNDHLMISLESQRSLQKIEEIARTTLGMVDPAATATLVVDYSQRMPGNTEMGRLDEQGLESDGGGVFAVLASWVNKILPLGGVEAGTLQR